MLLHDNYETSVETALSAIDILAKKGYRFVTVDELLKGELINKKTNLKTNKINSTINYKAEITLFKNFLLSLIPIICLVLYFVLFIFCGLEKTLNNLVEFIINKPLNNHSDMILFLLVPLWLCVISQTIIAIFFVLKVKHLKTSKFVKIITSIVIFFGFSIQYIGVVIYMVIISSIKNVKVLE